MLATVTQRAISQPGVNFEKVAHEGHARKQCMKNVGKYALDTLKTTLISGLALTSLYYSGFQLPDIEKQNILLPPDADAPINEIPYHEHTEVALLQPETGYTPYFFGTTGGGEPCNNEFCPIPESEGILTTITNKISEIYNHFFG